MPAIRAFFNFFIDALFPIHPMEAEVLGMNGFEAWKCLPRAPISQEPLACGIFAYKDTRVSRLIWSIKYKKSHKGSEIAGYALWKMLCYMKSALPKEIIFIVLPMPVSRARRRERGFNQCELIVDKIKQLDAAGQFTYSYNLLTRAHHTARQTLKNREGRLASMKDIFKINEKNLLFLDNPTEKLGRGSENSLLQQKLSQNISREKYFVIVIDDVITTGSTIRCAIETLRQAGFVHSWGLSVAH